MFHSPLKRHMFPWKKRKSGLCRSGRSTVHWQCAEEGHFSPNRPIWWSRLWGGASRKQQPYKRSHRSCQGDSSGDTEEDEGLAPRFQRESHSQLGRQRWLCRAHEEVLGSAWCSGLSLHCRHSIKTYKQLRQSFILLPPPKSSWSRMGQDSWGLNPGAYFQWSWLGQHFCLNLLWPSADGFLLSHL